MEVVVINKYVSVLGIILYIESGEENMRNNIN